ncbi:MAG: hypothetical protein AB7H86_22305 [Blastocatellales bacterium]
MWLGIKYRFNQARIRTEYALQGLVNYSKLGNLNGHGPSITAVMVGRNDDYMADFAQRLRATIEWNLKYLAREAIFVEWNPPADRPLLGPGLTERFPNLRVYVVPESLHQSVCDNPKLPVMEYHAKNVGIRRAKTDWIIATNADVAFSAEVILAMKELASDEKQVLTAQRIDIPWREFRTDGIGILDNIRYRRIIPYAWEGTGDFQMASRTLWHSARGYDENMLKHRIGCDIRGTHQLIKHGAYINRIGRILHLAHPTSCTEKIQDHHGEYAHLDDLPYQNGPGWGFGDHDEIKIAERVWRIQ